MKTCDEIRPQIGAYVLGGLEPEEAAEVREHLAHCRDCAREHAELAELPAKLDLIEAPEEACSATAPNAPPPPPPLEETILDRHAPRGGGRCASMPRSTAGPRRCGAAGSAAGPVRAAPRRRRRFAGGPCWAATGEALAGAVAVLGGRRHDAGRRRAGRRRLQPRSTRRPLSPRSSTREPGGARAPTARPGLHAVPAGTAVKAVSARGLPGGRSYELWWRSGGTGAWVSRGHVPGRSRTAMRNARLTAAARRGEYGSDPCDSAYVDEASRPWRGAVMG
jgi:hypothetical protein